MIFETLNQDNVEDYIAYLKIAMSEEPDMMTAEEIDEQGIKARILDPFFNSTISIFAKENGKVVGRIEYHFQCFYTVFSAPWRIDGATDGEVFEFCHPDYFVFCV